MNGIKKEILKNKYKNFIRKITRVYCIIIYTYCVIVYRYRSFKTFITDNLREYDHFCYLFCIIVSVVIFFSIVICVLINPILVIIPFIIVFYYAGVKPFIIYIKMFEEEYARRR
jgi:hypothetical protein